MAKSVNNNQRHNFHWTTKVGNSHEDEEIKEKKPGECENSAAKPPLKTGKNDGGENAPPPPAAVAARRKKLQAAAVARLRSVVITAFGRNRQQSQQRVVLGTLFGNKRGNVYFAFQKDAKLQPALLIQLATPITGLVREMASGLVRITLESDKRENKPAVPLLDEPMWRTYYNGIKCGSAMRLECGPREWKILKAVEPISMGAGVLPAEGEGEEEVIYMRAKFERVVGSTDSEALYMVNPDNNAATELSIYLLRL